MSIRYFRILMRSTSDPTDFGRVVFTDTSSMTVPELRATPPMLYVSDVDPYALPNQFYEYVLQVHAAPGTDVWYDLRLLSPVPGLRPEHRSPEPTPSGAVVIFPESRQDDTTITLIPADIPLTSPRHAASTHAAGPRHAKHCTA